jgi:hypothetical protein
MKTMPQCKACEKSFVPVVAHQKYCSQRCRNLRTSVNYAAYTKRVCEYCEREFNPTRKWQKFCSEKCQKDHSNKKNDATQKMREFHQRIYDQQSVNLEKKERTLYTDQFKKYADRLKPKACEICGSEDDGIIRDHCHQSGCFRGWICNHCNWALGNAKDNIQILSRMIEYLEIRSR